MLRKWALLNLYRLIFGLGAGLGVLLAACSGGGNEVTPAGEAATAPSAAPTMPGGLSATPAERLTPPASSAAGSQLWLVLASEGNEARYQVREQLADRSFPSDAVGATSAISGTLVLAADGTVVSEGSRFVVDLRTLRSDRAQRDRYIQRSTLETSDFPTAEFVPTEVRGLPSPLPTSGDVTFQLVGDLTLHGVTRSTTWDVQAQVRGSELVGTATTSFTFGDFGMEVPRVMVVLSVEDNIRLEFDFHLVRDSSQGS